MAYYREYENQRILVAANFGKDTVELQLEYPVRGVILSNQNKVEKPEQVMILNSCEVIVLECGDCKAIGDGVFGSGEHVND